MRIEKLNLWRSQNNLILKVSLVTGLVMILLQHMNNQVIEQRLKIDYYVSVVAALFLVAGLFFREREVEVKAEVKVEAEETGTRSQGSRSEGLLSEELIRDAKNKVEAEVKVEAKAGAEGSIILNELAKLTNREYRVLELMMQGKSNKEIAELTFVEVSTVKTHINHIYGKLSVKNRREASLKYEYLIKGRV